MHSSFFSLKGYVYIPNLDSNLSSREELIPWGHWPEEIGCNSWARYSSAGGWLDCRWGLCQQWLQKVALHPPLFLRWGQLHHSCCPEEWRLFCRSITLTVIHLAKRNCLSVMHSSKIDTNTDFAASMHCSQPHIYLLFMEVMAASCSRPSSLAVSLCLWKTIVFMCMITC